MNASMLNCENMKKKYRNFLSKRDFKISKVIFIQHHTVITMRPVLSIGYTSAIYGHPRRKTVCEVTADIERFENVP